jgi:putative DNA primase/helicase
VKAAYTLAGGQGRGRLSKDAQRRDTERFRTMSLSTGELNFDELERQAAGAKRQAFAGAEMRLPSIPADTGKHGSFEDIGDFTGMKNGAARFADTLQSSARDHYGHAGPRFVEKIIEEVGEIGEYEFRREIAALVREFVVSVELEDGSDNAVQRLLRTFGLIAAAGQLACRWDILPLEEDEIRWGVATCFKAWIGARGGSRSKTSNTALIELRDFLQQNDGRFILVGNTERPKAANIAGYIETKDGDTIYYILPPIWKNEVLAKAPRAKLIEALEERGLLIRKPDSSDPTVVKRIKALGKPVRAYAVSGDILSMHDDGTIERGHATANKGRSRVANISDYRRRSA